MNRYSTTIDDEFASLFLQELQNTRSESVKNDKNENLVSENSINSSGGGNGNGSDNSNGAGNRNSLTNDNENQPSSTIMTTSSSNIDYMNSIDLDTHTNNLMMMSGAASYARYLPLETTFTTNFFEFNDIYDATSNDDHINNKNISSRLGNGDLIRNSSSMNVFSMDMPAKDDDSSDINNPLNTDTGDLNTQKTEKQETDEMINRRLMHNISEYVLSLQELSETIIDPACEISKLNLKFKGNISGRLFIDPDSFNRLTGDLRSLNSKDSTDIIQLYCYRRNSITVNFAIDLRNLFSDFQNQQNQPFDKVSIQIFSSLRKRDNKEGNPNMIKEEFKFHGFQDNGISNSIQMNGSNISLGYDDLYKIFGEGNNDIEFNWEQVRFNSATASNRHDIANKYHMLVLQVNFLNSDGNVLYNKTFESYPIIVRGRNPRFYSEKGDILIGKIKKIAGEPKSIDDMNESTTIPPSTKRQRPHTTLKLDTSSSLSPPLQPAPSSSSPSSSSSNVNPGSDNKFTQSESEKANRPVSVVNEANAEADAEISDDSGGDNNNNNNNCMNSSYQYFKVEDNYYLPPVEVGYFPHHVHHNKQVFKTNVIPPGVNNGLEIKRQYNYFL